MADPFYGEIRAFCFNFPPVDWAYCDGSIVPIAQNLALYAVIGDTYGGDYVNTFALPDLMGASPIGVGQGPGLTNRALGVEYGSAVVTLHLGQIAHHNHLVTVATPSAAAPGQTGFPGSSVYPSREVTPLQMFSNASANATFNDLAVHQTGGSQPHPNQQPYLAFNFCICTNGEYPAPAS